MRNKTQPLGLVLSLFAGLLVLVILVAATGTNNPSEVLTSSGPGGALCAVPYTPNDGPTGSVNDTTGFPLKIPTTGYVYDSGCGGSPHPKLNAESYLLMMTTWQFYADWLIWSAGVFGLYLGLMFLRQERNAHTRH